MPNIIFIILALIPGLDACAQGTVLFDNRVPGLVDARVYLWAGTGPGGQFPGPEYTAQLYGGPAGSSSLAPLFPTTSFKTGSVADWGYLNPVVVSVPGVPAGSRATLLMRLYNGSSLETSSSIGGLIPIVVTLGGGGNPPSALIGLQSIITGIPEPSTMLLFLLGAGTVFLRFLRPAQTNLPQG